MAVLLLWVSVNGATSNEDLLPVTLVPFAFARVPVTSTRLLQVLDNQQTYWFGYDCWISTISARIVCVWCVCACVSKFQHCINSMLLKTEFRPSPNTQARACTVLTVVSQQYINISLFKTDNGSDHRNLVCAGRFVCCGIWAERWADDLADQLDRNDRILSKY